MFCFIIVHIMMQDVVIMDAGIRQLPNSVSKLLCSTQIITSPTSVIKELIENALDAGSTNIDVKLESFGLDRIEVRDNGCGIKLQDAQYMALPHCTSKIYCENDLSELSTYGFRGEALSAICNIGEVIISTKSITENIGTTFSLDSFGNIISQNPCSLNQGTCVVVTKLFKNVPVRRQYYSTMIKKKEETKHVEDILREYAVVKHDVRFTLYHNKRLIWQKGRSTDLKSSLQQVLGISLVRQLEVLNYKNVDNQVEIMAFLPKVNSCIQTTGRLQPDMSFVFVNQRPVKLKVILQILKQYYSTCHGLSGSGMKYPTCCLCIQMPSEMLDVNVDPSKTQVFFHNKEVILNAIETMLGNLYDENASVSNNVNSKGNNQSEIKDNSESNPPAVKDGSAIGETVLSSSLPSSQSMYTAQQNSDCVPVVESPTSEILSPSTNSENINDAIREMEVTFDFQNAEWDSQKSDNINEFGVVSGELVEPIDKICSRSELEVCLDQSHSKEQFMDKGEVNSFTSTQWSRGCIKDDSGKIVMPPQILVGTVKRNLLSDGNKSDRESNDIPVKKKQKSSDITSSVIGPLDGFFRNVTDTQQETQIILHQPIDNAQSKKKSADAKPKTEKNKCKKLQALHSRQVADSPMHEQNLIELSKKFIKSNTPSKPQPKVVQITFNIEKMKKTLESLGAPTSSLGSQVQCSLPQNEITFIGKLDNGFWIVYRNSNLEVLHHHRVSETLLYHRLMANHKISTHPLEIPTVLTESHLGEKEWKTLLAVSLHDKGSDSVSSIMDERITGNGFNIRRYDGVETKNVTMHLVGVADHVPFYGINDLKECLSKIAIHPSNTLQQCRPLKVSHYLKGEAIRISRGQASHLNADDIHTLLHGAEEQLPEIQKCLHGLPFFTAIYNMEAIPEILDDDI